MNISIRVLICIFSLYIFVPFAQAETPFDITSCLTGPATVLSPSKELVILGVEFKGIIMSNHENKIFDNFITHFVGVSRIMAGQVDGRGYTKLTDLDGALIFTETTAFGPVGQPTWKWKFLYGTGKWKGITGSASVLPITKRSPLVEGTWRACYKITGTFELPKKASEKKIDEIDLCFHSQLCRITTKLIQPTQKAERLISDLRVAISCYLGKNG